VSITPYDKRRGVMVTPKQILILKELIRRNPDGSALDVYQLIERCAPGTSRGSMICSLRHLAGHDLIAEAGKVLRGGRRRMTYVASNAGVELMRPKTLPGGTP
jgi:hypothetical protein